jgi:tRNA(Ile)-lysidine synthase
MASAVVAIRSAVRPYLESCEAGDVVLVAVSGGADSLALAGAILKEATALTIKVIGVTINHQLQDGAKEQADKVKAQLLELGYLEVIIRDVTVSMSEGLEAGARAARYLALDAILNEVNAKQIYLGHTRDDQAETVLLGLARGSGTRSLSGMAWKNKNYIRPLLSITREETEAACQELGLTPWRDPHNQNTDFTRVRVRENVLPVMEENLGPGISAALARSAALFRDDADALDELANREIEGLNLADLECSYLEKLPRALRSRILRRAIYAAGAPGGAISAEHLAGVEALVTAWHGQGEVSLPGGVKVARISGRLSLLARQ